LFIASHHKPIGERQQRQRQQRNIEQQKAGREARRATWPAFDLISSGFEN
jgi:hypothetical protein